MSPRSRRADRRGRGTANATAPTGSCDTCGSSCRNAKGINYPQKSAACEAHLRVHKIDVFCGLITGHKPETGGLLGLRSELMVYFILKSGVKFGQQTAELSARR